MREFGRTVGKEVNAFRRQTRKIVGDRHDGPDELAEAIASIEERAAKTIERIEEHADDARDELVQLDIAIRTQTNRTRRLDTREEEARAEVEGLAAEAKSRLQHED